MLAHALDTPVQPSLYGITIRSARELEMAMTHQYEEQARFDRSSLWLPPGLTPSRRQAPGRRRCGPHLSGSRWSGSHWSGSHRATERAVIGDQLREVAAWCELSPCIARYTDAKALGQADVVARAVAAGWRKDAVGRLICPECQQLRPIWGAAPVVPRAKRRSASRGSW